jgi:O-antigen/teichoic acid export membrane protein
MVVPYSCTAKLVNVLSQQPHLIMQAAVPGLSELKAGESREHIFRATTALSQAMLMLTGLVACVTLMVNRGFVGWWVGKGQYAGAELTILFVVVLLLRHWCTTAVYTNFCFGYERRTTVAMLLDGVVTLTASVLLVRRFGLIGAPLGSIVGLCAGSLPLNLFTLGRELGKNLVGLVKPLYPWFWRFLILAGAAAWLGRLLGSLNFFQLAAVSVLTTLVYAIVMYYPVRYSVLGGYLQPRFATLSEKVWMPNRLRALVRSAV